MQGDCFGESFCFCISIVSTEPSSFCSNSACFGIILPWTFCYNSAKRKRRLISGQLQVKRRETDERKEHGSVKNKVIRDLWPNINRRGREKIRNFGSGREFGSLSNDSMLLFYKKLHWRKHKEETLALLVLL